MFQFMIRSAFSFERDIASTAALLLLLAFVAAAIYSRHRVRRAAFLLVLGLFFSGAVLFFPYYYFHDADMGSLIRALSYSVRAGFKTISGGLDTSLIDDVIGSVQPFASPLCRAIYKALLYIYIGLGPVLTSGLLISFISDFAERFSYLVSFKRKYHVFSQLNEESLNIARRVREKNPKDGIIFCEGNGVNEALALEAKDIYAIILRASCDGLRVHFWKRNLEFYLVSEDNDRNIRLAEELICIYRNSKKKIVVINAFAESGTAIRVVEKMNKGRIGMRFIDRTALICSQLLLQEPLYDIPEDKKLASLMIAGCGKTGLQMLKTAAWCGASAKHGLKIRVYDKDAEHIEKSLKAQCPELTDNCDLAFVSCDVDSDAFEKLVFDEKQGSPDATCVFIATGDDERNIDLAERLYRMFRCHNEYGETPKILSRVRSSVKSDIYVAENNKYLEERNIRLFGSLNSVFNHSSLFHSQLERLSFAVELCYNGLLPANNPYDMSLKELENYLSQENVVKCRNNFMHSEYMRRSSMAAALHIPEKLHGCGIIDRRQPFLDNQVADKFEKLLAGNENLLESLAYLEHSRWLAYMRSDGYCRADWDEFMQFYPKLENKKTQDELSKRHLCMVDWSQLDELNEKYNSLNPPKKRDFKDSDRCIVSNIPTIIRLTNLLEETDLDISLYP